MMGMGEPLQNYSALVPALRMMLDDHGYGLSRRRVTVSTSGVVPMIDRLRRRLPGGAGRVAARAERRTARQPGAAQSQVPAGRTVGRVQPLPRARAARLHHLRVLHARWRERPAGACAPAGELVQRHGGNGVSCKFNLIPFNPFPQSGLTRSPHNRCSHSRKSCSDAGIVTTVRKTRGDDIDAACGQLAGDVKDRTRVGAAHRPAARRDAETGAALAPAPRRHEVMTRRPVAYGRSGDGWHGAGARAARCLRRGGCAAHAPAAPDAARHRDRVRRTRARKRARIRMELAVGYFEQGQMTSRSTSSSRRSQPTPRFAEAYNLRGLIYMRLNDMRQAEDSFRRAAALNPRDADMHAQLRLVAVPARPLRGVAARVRRGAWPIRSTPGAPRR